MNLLCIFHFVRWKMCHLRKLLSAHFKWSRNEEQSVPNRNIKKIFFFVQEIYFFIYCSYIWIFLIKYSFILTLWIQSIFHFCIFFCNFTTLFLQFGSGARISSNSLTNFWMRLFTSSIRLTIFFHFFSFIEYQFDDWIGDLFVVVFAQFLKNILAIIAWHWKHKITKWTHLKITKNLLNNCNLIYIMFNVTQ